MQPGHVNLWKTPGACLAMDENKNVARKPKKVVQHDTPLRRFKRRRRSGMSSSEESEEENSDVAPDLGMQPESVRHVQQSTQDRLNDT